MISHDGTVGFRIVVEQRQSRRDGGITALVLGVFAVAWFGWVRALGRPKPGGPHASPAETRS